MNPWKFAILNIVISVIATASVPLDSVALKRLPFTTTELLFYRIDHCAHANLVQIALDEFVLSHHTIVIHIKDATANFPSPTLRMPHGDAYLNFIGKNNVLNAINSMINQQPFP